MRLISIESPKGSRPCAAIAPAAHRGCGASERVRNGAGERRQEEGRAEGNHSDGGREGRRSARSRWPARAGIAGGVSCKRERHCPGSSAADQPRWRRVLAGRPNLCARRGPARQRWREREFRPCQKPNTTQSHLIRPGFEGRIPVYARFQRPFRQARTGLRSTYASHRHPFAFRDLLIWCTPLWAWRCSRRSLNYGRWWDEHGKP